MQAALPGMQHKTWPCSSVRPSTLPAPAHCSSQVKASSSLQQEVLGLRLAREKPIGLCSHPSNYTFNYRPWGEWRWKATIIPTVTSIPLLLLPSYFWRWKPPNKHTYSTILILTEGLSLTWQSCILEDHEIQLKPSRLQVLSLLHPVVSEERIWPFPILHKPSKPLKPVTPPRYSCY